MERKVRLQLDVDPASAALADKLVERVGAASRAEIMRRAIELMYLFVAIQRDGGSITFVKPNGVRNPIIFLF